MRAALFGAAMLLVAAACSSSSGDGRDADSSAAADGELVEDTIAGADADRVLEGTIIDRTTLVAGDCFNEYRIIDENGSPREFTATVDCVRDHDGEVYFVGVDDAPPGATYPGVTDLEDEANEQCYDSFESFVGTAYEFSDLEIATQYPTFDQWVFGGSRRLHCFVVSYDETLLRGSMRQSNL